MKKIFVYAMLLLAGVSCQKMEISEGESSEVKLDQDRVRLKALLVDRDTRWTVDELEIPAEVSGVFQITNDKELAFLLEFGCPEGGKYKLVNSIDVAASALSEKFSSEIGIEKFVDFEFDGSGNTISGLNLPVAAGLFSEVSGTSKVSGLTLSGCTIGNAENLSNLLGTGALIGLAKGSLEVSGVTVSGASVMAPCKVGGLVGSFVDGTAEFTDCKVSGSTVKTLYFKGISGWCGGFIGFVGRSQEKNTALAVSVTADGCSVEGSAIKAHMESDTRFSGKFVGTLVGYDAAEAVYVNDCSITENTTLEITDAKGSAFVPKDPDAPVGGHKYQNGTILIDGGPYVLPWDGVSKTEPALEGDTYMVYTADELAWFQGQKVTNKIRICDNINMGKKPFTPILEAVYIDGQKDGQENYEIQNLKITFKHTKDADGYGGAFINRVKTNNTVHKNLNFRGIDVYVNHYDVVPEDLANPGQYGNAYAATLCSRVNSGMTYNVSNVHCYNGNLNGVCKMGGLLGGSWGTLTVENCSVEDYWIENREVNCINKYYKEALSGSVTCSAQFYTEGECGGLIGFIAKNATISNCSVKNTKMKCYGQQDQKVSFGGSLGWLLGKMCIAGRHVNQFIGDIRTQSEDENNPVTVNIVEPVVSGNVYVGSGYMYAKKADNTELSADSSDATDLDYNHSWSSASTPYIGCVYYVGASVSSAHMGDYAGNVYVTKDGTKSTVSVFGGRQ